MISRPTLLAFDFDGTLAPIRNDPAAVRMPRAAAALLAEASALPGVVVAIVSGRDAGDLAVRANITGAYLVGSHGLEIRGPGGALIRDEPPLDVAVDAGLVAATEAAGLRLESKKHGVTLHWRGAPPAVAEPLAERFRDWGRGYDLELIEGRCVVEAHRRGGGKAGALRWLCSALGAERVVYTGDDVGDFEALRFAAGHGRGVFVASSERTAPAGVTVVETFRDLFRLIREEVMI